ADDLLVAVDRAAAEGAGEVLDRGEVARDRARVQVDHLRGWCQGREFGLRIVSPPPQFWKTGARFFLGNRAAGDLVHDSGDLALGLTERSLKRSAFAGTLRHQALSLRAVGREIALDGARVLELRLERGHHARLDRRELIGFAVGAASPFLAPGAIDA